MQIRLANTQDCAVLAELDAQSNPSPWTKEQFSSTLSLPINRIDVVEQAQQIVAFAVWQVIAGEAELHLLATHAHFRKQGLATSLLQHFITAPDAPKRLFLEVRQSNVVAQNLYQKLGFQMCGKRKAYYSLPNGLKEDAVLMERVC